MKRNVLTMTLALVATGSLLADPKDDVQGAVKKLGDASSYSWSTKTENAGGGGGGFGGRGGGPSSGKASKDGYAIITRTFGENTMETVIKGDKSVMKNQEGAWQTPEEMMAAFGGGQAGAPGGGRGGRGGMFGRGGAATMPAAEAQALLGGVKDLKSADGAISGDLTKEAVASRLFPFGGRGGRAGGEAPPPPENAKGSVKFWVKDGSLAKYEYNVQGTMSFGGNDMEINRTTTVEIKDVGATKVEVPEDAKKKLQ